MIGYNLPGDAIYSPTDCNMKNWNINWDNKTGCVGGGEGTTIQSGDFFYMLIETVDVSLNCITTLGFDK